MKYWLFNNFSSSATKTGISSLKLVHITYKSASYAVCRQASWGTGTSLSSCITWPLGHVRAVCCTSDSLVELISICKGKLKMSLFSALIFFFQMVCMVSLRIFWVLFSPFEIVSICTFQSVNHLPQSNTESAGYLVAIAVEDSCVIRVGNRVFDNLWMQELSFSLLLLWLK